MTEMESYSPKRDVCTDLHLPASARCGDIEEDRAERMQEPEAGEECCERLSSGHEVVIALLN